MMVITSHAEAPTRSVTVGSTTYAYRELGPQGGIPVVFFVHLAATLDNWDPRIVDAIAKTRHVITFDQRGVGASTGEVPDTLEAAADHAYEFITALGFDKIDIFSFSMGGFIAQDLIVKHPDLVRRLVLTGTGPRGGKDIDKVVGPTYWDILRAAVTRSDPKEFLFFQRDQTGKAAGKAFIKRLQERTVDRDHEITVKALRTQLKAIQKYGRSAPSDLSGLTQPTLIANGDNDRMVPSVLSEDLHRRIRQRADHLPRLRPRRDLPVPRGVRSCRRRLPRRCRMKATRHFSSSILLWMRSDQPRQDGMDYWKGPHSGIIAASPGLEEYRQIHLAETNPGLWPDTEGVETAIPSDRKVDGIAEVTFQSPLSPVHGRAQTALAFKDEVNVFRRTLLYAGAPGTSRWYDVASPAETTGARAVIYLRRRDGVRGREFRRVLKKELVPALVDTGTLTELRTQTFLPWNEKTWATPNVAHDNPADQRYHASLFLGFASPGSRSAFFEGTDIPRLSETLTPVASAIHAYDVSTTLTYVSAGNLLDPPHQN